MAHTQGRSYRIYTFGITLMSVKSLFTRVKVPDTLNV